MFLKCIDCALVGTANSDWINMHGATVKKNKHSVTIRGTQQCIQAKCPCKKWPFVRWVWQIGRTWLGFLPPDRTVRLQYLNRECHHFQFGVLKMIQSILTERGKKPAANATIKSPSRPQVTLKMASGQLNLQQHCMEGSHGQEVGLLLQSPWCYISKPVLSSWGPIVESCVLILQLP